MPNEWTRKMPSGWRPGYCAICDIPCQQDQHKSVDCPFESARQEPEKKLVECSWCEGLGHRTVPDGEGHIVQESCYSCGGTGKKEDKKI